MKLKNIFRKAEKAITKSNITKMDKNQLEKIVGGATEGQPIGGIIVKGGHNPGGSL